MGPLVAAHSLSRDTGTTATAFWGEVVDTGLFWVIFWLL